MVPQLFSVERCQRLRSICDGLLGPKLAHYTAEERGACYVALDLTDRKHLPDDDAARELFAAITDEAVLRLARTMLGAEPLFSNTYYYYDPPEKGVPGNWHRDLQLDGADVEEQQRRMRAYRGMHCHIALVDNTTLEYIPGSHLRWDSALEFEIRSGLSGHVDTSDEMPGGEKVPVKLGDAILFDPWGIHRGNYDAGRLRRTLDLFYTDLPILKVPRAHSLWDPSVLALVPDKDQPFFERVLSQYNQAIEEGQL